MFSFSVAIGPNEESPCITSLLCYVIGDGLLILFPCERLMEALVLDLDIPER